MAVDSTYNVGSWHSENGIIVPGETTGRAQTETTPKAVAKPKPKAKVKYTSEAVGVWRIDAAPSAPASPAPAVQSVSPVAGDSTVAVAAADSVAADSVAKPVRKGMVLISPMVKEEAPSVTFGAEGMSWVFLGLGVLFCAVALKFKNNTRYIKALMTDLVDVRVRSNVFDETVKETSFLILLNLMWICCAGVLLWQTIRHISPAIPGNSFTIPDNPALGIAICTGCAAVYLIGMLVFYFVVGNVFSDSVRTKMWIKGAAASSGLEVMLLFPVALLTLCYAPWVPILLLIAGAAFLIGKIIFIYKGFRIFFSEISSWMLFLCYLCSLEIVPLILTYFAALYFCSVWL